MTADNSLGLTKCVVIINPASTNRQRALRLAKKLEVYFQAESIERLQIVPGEADKTHALIVKLSERLDEKTLVCVAGGDGTVSLIINILLQESKIPAKAKKAVILPLWGGNANDLASMINGSVYKINLERILKKGRVVAVHPLEVSMKGEQSETKLAINYVSFGATAYAAKRVNQIDYQRKRLYRTPGIQLLAEAASAMRSIQQSKSFMVDIDGKSARLYDLILINGSRIAKVYRAPNRLTEKTFFELIIRRKHPVLLPYFARILKALALERNLKTEHRLVVHEPTWAQIDGEVIKLPARTDIKVALSAAPFYLLSTKLKA
jgi:diacylglycerol kinase family enzyme